MESPTDTNAGNGTSITSSPNSVWRVTRTWSPTSSSDACDTNGRRSSSATAATSTPPSPSLALLSEQHQIGMLPIEDGGQHPGRAEQIGPFRGSDR